MDRNGHAITFAYDNAGLLASITNEDNTTLLTIHRVADGTGNIAWVQDCYGRAVFYHTGVYTTLNVPLPWAQSYQELDRVSQVVPATPATTSPTLPDRYVLGYQLVSDRENREQIAFLHTISVPSPKADGSLATSFINYDPSTDFVSSLVDANGNNRSYQSVDVNGNSAYPSNYTKVSVADALGNVAYSYLVTYDNSMNSLGQTDGAGRPTSYPVYNDPNDMYRPSSVKDGNGNQSIYTWDTHGNLLTETSPRGVTTTNTYDYSHFALGELTSTQEGTKTSTTYTYNEPSGLVQSMNTPTPGTVGAATRVTTSFTYDNYGNPLTITTPGNNAASSLTTQLDYGASHAIGQPLTITDALGKTTQMRYDSQGQIVAEIDALGNETDSSYNEGTGTMSLGNQVQSATLPATGQTGTGHSGSANTYLYPGGPLLSTTSYDENNNAIRQVVTTYGKEGETLSVSGSTEPVSYTYDALYRMRTLTDAAAHTTSYFYNAAGYLQQVVYPGAGTPSAPLTAGSADTMTFTGYDPDGNLLARVDGRGQTTTYTYNDVESNLTDITYPNGTIGAVHFNYDQYGRRGNTTAGSPGMTDGTGSQAYVYDDDDNLTAKQVTWAGLPAKVISYGFYPNGSRSGMTADGQAFSYGYDKDGRITGMTNPFNEPSAWTYRDNGWLQTRALGNASGSTVATTTYTQNPLGEVTSLLNQSGSGATLSQYGNMTYDGVGNRMALAANVPSAPTFSGTTSYQYDYAQSANPQLNRSQLTGESSTRATGSPSYAYDGGTSGGPGNPTSFKGQAQSFNADNQQTGTGFGYDGNGNPITYRSQALSFDPENRMTADSTGSQTNAYDGDDLRVWKQSSGVTTYFLYAGTQPVCEYTSNGTTTALAAVNTFGTDGLVSRHTSAGSTFYAFDERGNVSQRLSSTSAVMCSDLYDAYGTRMGTAPQADPFGYEAQAGYYTDTETGLILCMHRFYDPSNGRWLNRDPIGYEGEINLYGYTGSDPLKWNDFSGLLSSQLASDGTERTSNNGMLISDSDGHVSLIMPKDDKISAKNNSPILCSDPVPDPQDHCTSSEKLAASIMCQAEGKSGVLYICTVTYTIPHFLRAIHFECIEDVLSGGLV